MIIVEEHQASGGVGELVSKILIELFSKKLITTVPSIKFVSIPDEFLVNVGSQDYLRRQIITL